MMKRIVCLFISIVFSMVIVGCSAMTRTEETHSASESVDKTDTAHIYDGYEELQGKDVGNIVMPEKIEPQQPDGIYSFKLETKKDINAEADFKRLLKAFLGDSFDEKNINCDIEDLLRYSSLDKDDGAYSNGDTKGVVNLTLGTEYENATIFSSEQTAVYDAQERDAIIELKEGSCTVGELCDTASAFLKENITNVYNGNYELKPIKVRAMGRDGGTKYAEVICAFSYKGIMIENESTPLFTEIYDNEGYEMNTFYMFMNSYFRFLGKDKMTTYHSTPCCFDITETKLDNIISLRSAAEIVAAELAPNSRYQIRSVELMYCCKTTKPVITADLEASKLIMEKHSKDINETYEPTWVFYCRDYSGTGSVYAIKVNAITGEITIDK